MYTHSSKFLLCTKSSVYEGDLRLSDVLYLIGYPKDHIVHPSLCLYVATISHCNSEEPGFYHLLSTQLFNSSVHL